MSAENVNVNVTMSYFRAETDAAPVELTIGGYLAQAASLAPERDALIVPASAAGAGGRPERRWTYRELEILAHRVAQALLARFKPGDHVATWVGMRPEMVFLEFGAALAGMTLVTINPANRAAELQYLLQLSNARGLIFEPVYRKLNNLAVLYEIKDALPELTTLISLDDWDTFLTGGGETPLPEVAPEDPALLLFTSGSTGRPKGALLSHSAIITNAALTAKRLEVKSGAVWLNMLPMFHIGGTGTMTLGSLSVLGTQVMLEFTPEAMLDALQRYHVNITMAVPTMLVALLNSPAFAGTDLSALEVITAGGSPVPPALLRRVKASMSADIVTLMGQTEAAGAMFATRRGDDEALVTGSVGPPLALTEAKIVAARTGEILPIGQIGEICIRAHSVMLGYIGAPEKTRETLDGQGWLHTGDLGVMLEHGYIQVTGRLKEMIIRGGENIYPREVEDALAELPEIAQAAVFGIPDEKWGEQVACAVIARAGSTIDFAALEDKLRTRLSRHKVPKIWRSVEQFPLNASGKIQKFLLQAQVAAEEEQKRG